MFRKLGSKLRSSSKLVKDQDEEVPNLAERRDSDDKDSKAATVITTSNIGKYTLGQPLSDGFVVGISAETPGATNGPGKLEIGPSAPAMPEGVSMTVTTGSMPTGPMDTPQATSNAVITTSNIGKYTLGQPLSDASLPHPIQNW